MLHKRCSTKKRLYLGPFLSRKMPQNILKLHVNNFCNISAEFGLEIWHTISLPMNKLLTPKQMWIHRCKFWILVSEKYIMVIMVFIHFNWNASYFNDGIFFIKIYSCTPSQGAIIFKRTLDPTSYPLHCIVLMYPNPKIM